MARSRTAATITGDPLNLYAGLVTAQQAAYLDLDLGRYAITSASHQIRTRPMKGTAARDRRADHDRAQARRLRASLKEQADLVRNDLAKIAVLGSVRVTELFAVEQCPTVALDHHGHGAGPAR